MIYSRGVLTPVNTLTRSIYILKRKKFFLLLKKINSRVPHRQKSKIKNKKSTKYTPNKVKKGRSLGNFIFLFPFSPGD